MLLFGLLFYAFVVECRGAFVKEFELTGHWNLSNVENATCVNNLQIPSGVYSALFSDDTDFVLKSTNDVDLRWIAHENWTYSTCFYPPPDYKKVRFINLTFHGIDTISTIRFNKEILGHTDNMFVRYTFAIQDLLRETCNCIEVELKSPIYVAKELAERNPFTPPKCSPESYNGECHINFLRKMQSSFGWDWGLAAPSMGIWKPVTLEMYDVAIIRDVVVSTKRHTRYWKINIEVFFETVLEQNFCGKLTFIILDLCENPITIYFSKTSAISYYAPSVKFDHKVDKQNVELWWPNGYGDQKLYDLHLTWKGKLCDDPEDYRTLRYSTKTVRFGIRKIELVQEDLEKGLSFYFRVNDIPIFMKGTNWIPSHVLPEKQANQDRIKHLLESVKTTNMNMIRVWGGGVYESDYFYELADYYGILIWQDMMFACATYPQYDEFLKSVTIEVVQNVRRISYHPSIAVWGTNNEIELALIGDWYKTSHDFKRFATDYRKFFVGLISFEISRYSDMDVLISSPSNGRIGEQEYFLSSDPQDNHYGDIHFYTYKETTDNWDPNIYPTPRFCSEYGFQSFPSMSSWEKTSEISDKLLSLVEHRQHYPQGNKPILSLLKKHFVLPDEDSENYLEAIVYYSQISQAMAVKAATEVFRSQRNASHHTMGALYWSLNDVWVAPSWSSIDYYGNYKILHHWLKEILAPVTVVAHMDQQDSISIYVIRDGGDYTVFHTLSVSVYLWSSLSYYKPFEWRVPAKPNSAVQVKSLELEELLIGTLNRDNCFFEFSLSRNGESISKSYLFIGKIKDAIGIQDPKIEVHMVNNHCRSNTVTSSLTIKVEKPALFVYIEFKRKRVERYKLSKNGYIQLNPIETIYLEFQDESCTFPSKSEIKVLTVNNFMAQNK